MAVPTGGLNNLSDEQIIDQNQNTGVNGVTTEDLKDFVLECQKEAEDAFIDIRKVWDECWAVTHEQHPASFDKKKEWQSKVFIPESGPAVRKATSLIQRILLRLDKWFDIQSTITEGVDPTLEAQRQAILYHCDRVRRGEKMDEERFTSILLEAVQSGFTLGLWILKLWWAPRKQQRFEISPGEWIPASDRAGSLMYSDPGIDMVGWSSSGLCAQVLDPRQCWFDPNHTFFIEENIVPFSYVLSQVEAGVFDRGVVDRLKEEDYGQDSQETERLKNLNINTASNSFRKTVHLYEYWGDIYNRDGQLVMENARIVVGNKKFVLNPDRLGNPFWHGQNPYIIGGPIRSLFRHEGKSLVEATVSIQRSINNIACMSLDGLLWKLLKIRWINLKALTDPKQVENLFPGICLMAETNNPPMGEVDTTDVPSGALAETEILRRAIQNDTSVTDFMRGISSKGKTTATEFAGSQEESNSQFEGYGSEIEDCLIEPAVDKIRKLMIQFWRDFRDPALQAMAMKYGIPWIGVSPIDRLRFLIRNDVRIRAKGISGYFEKRERLKNIMEFLGIAGKVPPILARLKLQKLLDRILNYFSIPNPDELVITEQEEQALKASEQQGVQANGYPAAEPQQNLPPEIATALMQVLQGGGNVQAP